MENYKLRADEVVLYKGKVSLKGKKGSTELILTNINLVLINKYTPLFRKEEVTVLEHPVNTIKMYEGVPQVKTKDTTAEIYLLEKEIEVDFNSRMELHQFTNVVVKLLTGDDAVHRGAKKVKDSIALVDDTLGIDTVQTVGDVLKEGIVGSIAGALGKVGNLFNKNKK